MSKESFLRLTASFNVISATKNGSGKIFNKTFSHAYSILGTHLFEHILLSYNWIKKGVQTSQEAATRSGFAVTSIGPIFQAMKLWLHKFTDDYKPFET